MGIVPAPSLDFLKFKMALTSTIFNFDVELADSDRSIFQSFKCQAARHPSETQEFLLVRLLAFCLEFEDELKFSKGLSETDEPALWSKYPDGRVKAWIEVGVPAANRLHRASKLAERVAVYTHRPPAALLQQLAREKIFQAEQIPIYSFEPSFLRLAAEKLERRTKVSVSVSGRELYLELSGTHFSSPIAQRSAAET